MERENEIIANQNEIIGLLERQVEELKDQNAFIIKQNSLLNEQMDLLVSCTQKLYDCIDEMRQDLTQQSRHQSDTLQNLDRNLVIFAKHVIEQDKSKNTKNSNAMESTLEQ